MLSFASLFAGKMLGDGYMNITHKRPRFAFIHTILDKDYADYCFHLFSQHLPFGSNCKSEASFYDKRTQKTYNRVYYQSRTDEILDYFYSIWYHNGRKVLPMQWVASHLDTKGLALWFQDDGSLKKGGNRIVLSTESFTLEERIFLQSLLLTKFNIVARIDNQNRLDISSRREVRKFQALVEPFVHPSMSRKSMTKAWKEWKFRWGKTRNNQVGVCRTSIYLPNELYHRIRGEGYSHLLNGLLNEWLDKQWFDSILEPEKRYNWIINHENIKRGPNLLTPRFRPDVKGKLNILSEATGFDCSELVTMALTEEQL